MNTMTVTSAPRPWKRGRIYLNTVRRLKANTDQCVLTRSERDRCGILNAARANGMRARSRKIDGTIHIWRVK